jgi:hypothetical protein
MVFQEFSDEARIWVYQANRALTDNEQRYLKNQLSIFVDQWSAHGAKLTAKSAVLDEYRLAICAEGNVEASGCSIDSSVRFMKEMGAELGVDFFNRLLILSEENEVKELIPFSHLNDNPEKMIYHPSITSMQDFRNNSFLKAKEYLLA